MIFKPNYVYKINYTEANMGYFYGIYQSTKGIRHEFIYIFHEGSKHNWDENIFTCGDSETREIIELLYIDEYKEQFPEFFI